MGAKTWQVTKDSFYLSVAVVCLVLFLYVGNIFVQKTFELGKMGYMGIKSTICEGCCNE